MKHFLRARRNALPYAVLLLVICSLPVLVASQVSLFPLDYQLYPRDVSTNKATIKVQGTISQSTGYTQVRLKRYRDGSLQNTTYINLVYVNGVATYDITNQITAELRNYRFSLYGYKNFTETLLRTANNVVAGDAYIIQGQSNAVANLRGTFSTANNADDPSNAPNRNFVRVYGSGSATGNYTKGWFIGRGNVWYDVDGQTGQWGMRLASNLATARKVPICIINGASPGQRISYFLRNDGNATDPATNYGRLLTRIREAGLQNNIRGLIWHQGESDIQGSLSSQQLTTAQYKTYFKDLQNDWKSDYPGLNKFYIFQVRYGCGMSSQDNCLKIQEAQRQLDKESGEILTLGTSNTNQLFDGGTINYCHYNFYDGYKNMGDWVSRVIRRDLYFETSQPATIESPEPESAVFSIISGGVANQVSLALKNQGGSFTLSGDLTTLFRLDGGSYPISSVTLSGNNVLISFSRGAGVTTNPTGISYRSHDNVAAPQIINSGGLGLVHFENFPIKPADDVTPPPACTDPNEPNNSIDQTKSINANTTYTGSIGTANDEDWFRFRTWAPWRFVKVSIWGMAGDYDMYLYDQNGALLQSATGSGSTSEALIYNDGPDDFNYRLKVVSKDGSFDAGVCYSIRLQASSQAWPSNSPPYASSLNSAIILPIEVKKNKKKEWAQEFNVFPNPVRNKLHVNFRASDKKEVELKILDLSGRERIFRKVKASPGFNQHKLDVSKLSPGTYILQLRSEGSIQTKKIIVLR